MKLTLPQAMLLFLLFGANPEDVLLEGGERLGRPMTAIGGVLVAIGGIYLLQKTVFMRGRTLKIPGRA